MYEIIVDKLEFQYDLEDKSRLFKLMKDFFPSFTEFREFRDDRFHEYGGPPFDHQREREMREMGGQMMERGPVDPRERVPPQGMEPRDPRMRGEMRGPSDPRGQPPQRGPMDQRGPPPEGRPPSEIRGHPESWGPPPERRGPMDPRIAGEPRGNQRGELIFESDRFLTYGV